MVPERIRPINARRADAPREHKTMKTMRSVRSGLGRLALVAMLAVTVLGGTLAIGGGAASARTFAEFCASQEAGMNAQIGYAGEALREGNYRRSFALLAGAQAMWQTAADAGCYGSAA